MARKTMNKPKTIDEYHKDFMKAYNEAQEIFERHEREHKMIEA